MNNLFIPAVIYARYSSDSQREESIEGQLRECKAYAERNGIAIVGTYIDRAFSARTDARPEFQQMIKDSAKGIFEIVIVWKLDRFSRNRYDSARYKAALKKNGVKVVSATENISSGSEGIILESVLEGFAEYYSADLSEKVSRGMTENVLKGKYNGGKVPVGYFINDNREFEIDPVTGPLVLEAFKMYSRGIEKKEIVEWLHKMGVTNSYGLPMSYSSLTKMFKNRRYIGEFKFRDVVNKDAIPPIVPKVLFDKVQKISKRNQSRTGIFKADEKYILTTKIFCGNCKVYMCGESGKNQTGTKYRYYRCAGSRKGKGCTSRAIRKDWIENFVVSEIMKIIMDDNMIDSLVSSVMAFQQKDNINIPLYEQQVVEIDEAIVNIMQAIEKGIYTKTTRDRLEKLEKRKEELELKISEEKLNNPTVTEEYVREWLLKFRTEPVTKEEQQRMLIDSFLNSVYVYENKIVLFFNYKEGNWEVALPKENYLFGKTPISP